MKRPSERGTFGRWLVSERKARDLTPTEVRTRLREQRGFAMAHSTYAMIESGSRQPTDEQRTHLVAFFGTEPEPEPTAQTASDAVLDAIAEQTQWLRRQWEATTALTAGVTELVGEMRAAREGSLERDAALVKAILAGIQLAPAVQEPGEQSESAAPQRRRR